uniref:Actin-related protein 2/3 complex subunit 3 n=1 Tax=Stygiella incarcerata TaxID=1712417 RepID=A0A192ZI67_9EUKA|nr:actin-related protein 2/3 complex subunit 3 [Stygiella incarcerata]
MAYHSQQSCEGVQTVCNCPILPLKGKTRGIAPPFTGAEEERDIVDEAIYYFKANVLFKSFEVKSPADRLLVYLTLHISKCLVSLKGEKTLEGGIRNLQSLARGEVPLPGDAGFHLGGFFQAPRSGSERDTMRKYLKQLMEEVAARLPLLYFTGPDGGPNKYWSSFAKRRFLNIKV